MSWKQKGLGKPVELIFKFDSVRQFHKINIFTANLLHMGIQVFEKAVVWFSIGGEYYLQEPVTYVYMADTILKEPRNVSIRLDGRLGRFVKLELYFASVWISVSEVSFDSSPARGEFEAEKRPLHVEETTTTHQDFLERLGSTRSSFNDDSEAAKTQGTYQSHEQKINQSSA